MSSRRKERLGGVQTTVRSSRSSRSFRSLAPLSVQPSLALEARAQTATATGYDQILRAIDLRRATTARAASYRGFQRHEWHHEHTLPFPAVISTYDPDESNKFYASSSACRLGRIFSDPMLISPSWARVSTSPWEQSAKKCGGYGKRIFNGSNSLDTPGFMYSKLFERHQKDFSWKRRPRPFAYRGEAKTAVSDDTPKFFHGRHTQVYGRPVEHDGAPRLIKVLLGRQIITEPVVRETDLNAGTLKWDNTPLISRSKLRAQRRG